MGMPTAEWYERLNEVRHHLANALMGLDGLTREFENGLPTREVTSVRAALAGVVGVLDGWLALWIPAR